MCTWPSALAPVANPGMGNEEAKASTFFLISGRRESVSITLQQRDAIGLQNVFDHA